MAARHVWKERPLHLVEEIAQAKQRKYARGLIRSARLLHDERVGEWNGGQTTDTGMMVESVREHDPVQKHHRTRNAFGCSSRGSCAPRCWWSRCSAAPLATERDTLCTETGGAGRC